MQVKSEQVNNTKKEPGTVEKVVGYATKVSGYVDMAIEWTSRRKYEWLIIWLKEDLKIADTCKMVRENLLGLISKPGYFTPEVQAYFVKDGHQDYSISSKDPTQVAALKKLLNALDHAEIGLRALEEVDLSKDHFSPTIISDVVKAARKTVHEIYTTLQLVNESGPEIQNILAPNVNALLSRITLLNGKLQEYTPSQPEARSGAILASAVNLLPACPRTDEANMAGLSNLIYSLPNYFEYLQNLIPTSSSDIATKSVTSAREYQALMIQRANEAKQNFEALANRSSVFTLLPSCLTIGKALLTHSVDLMNAGAPLTKKAYLEAVEKLHDIKHNSIPQLIAELEQAEENMGLKRGVLTEPALKQMDAYYVQLATQVENIAVAAGVIDMASSQLDAHLNAWYGSLVKSLIGDKPPVVGEKIKPIPHLTIMQDEVFIARRKASQTRRLNEAELLITAEPEQLVAAERFFEKIGSYYTVLNYNWNLSKLSQTEKSSLLDDYKKFQSFFAARYPELDKLIVDAFDPRPDQSALANLAKRLGISNHFTAVSACKTAVLGDINQALDQTRDAQFKAVLIKGTIQHSEETTYKAQKEKTSLKVDVAPFSAATLAVESDPKPSAYYHEKAMVFIDQLSKLQAAEKAMTTFFELVEKHVRPNEAFHELDAPLKEKLRLAYKQFQPHVLAAAEEDAEFALLNVRLVTSLTDNGPSPQTPLKKADEYLAFMKQRVSEDLQELIDSSQENRTFYLARKQEALAQEKEVLKEQAHKHTLAKKAVENFFGLVKKHLGKDDAFDGLNKEIQEKLRDAYKKIRPQVLAVADFHPEYTLLDERITAGFTSPQLAQTPLKKENENLTLMQARITESLQQQVAAVGEGEKEALAKLQAAQKAVEVFFEIVKTRVGPNANFHELDDELKEELLHAYKQFQPHVLAAAETHPEFALLNTHLIASLSDAKYLARQAETVDTALKYEDTLFGQLAEVKLSKKIDGFLTKKLIPYLKENLSPAVWSQLSADGKTIDVSKLPFSNFHQDSQEVILYKKLINAVFHLKSSLAGLESLQGDPGWIFNRGLFVLTAFNALVMDLVGLKSSLSAVAGNPGLQALIKEDLALLLPLQNLPIIGDYVRAINEPAPVVNEEPVDIVALWEEQQDVVTSNIDPLSRSTKAYTRIFGEDTDRTEELFAALENTVNVPALLAVKDQVQTLYIDIYPFVTGTHVAANFPSDYISRIDNEDDLKEAVKKLQEIRSLIYSHATNGDFGILSARRFDNADNKREFAFYYTKVQPYLARLDGRYTPTFIDTLNTPEAYSNARKNILALGDKMQKLASAERTPTTLPKRRQEAVEASRAEQRKVETFLAFQRNTAYRELFGGTNLQNIEFSRAYKKFCTAITAAYEDSAARERLDVLARREDALMRAKDRLQSAYAKLYPVLATSPLAAEFPKDFISECGSEHDLTIAIANLHEAYALVVSQPGAYTQLKIMGAQFEANANYFDDEQNQQAFIVLYKKLQPYLAQLDEKYNADAFIQALKQGPHFASALQALYDLTLVDHLEPFKHIATQLDANEHYFDELQNRQDFIVLYKKLQPYLVKLDPKYNTDTFVQALEEADYFDAEPYVSALRDISNLPNLRSRLEALVVKEDALPPAPEKIAQVRVIPSVPTPEQAAAMVSIEDSLTRISAKFQELKAPETAKSIAKIEEEKKAKEKDLSELTVKISNLVNGLTASNVDSPALQDMLDTQQRLTNELAGIEKRLESASQVTKELDAQAKSLVKDLRSLPFSTDSITALRLTVTALEVQISRVAEDDPEQVRAALEVVRAEFRVHLQTAATQVEQAEGLAAGSLTESIAAINAQFDQYYDGLVTSFYPVSYLQLASEKLYQIADQLQKQKNPGYVLQTPEAIQQKAKAFAQQLDGLAYYDPRLLKKVMGSINQLYAQAAGIGTVSREIILANLKEIRSELGSELIAAADNAEYHLGLKPGTLATPISERFDDFYTGFITSIVATEETKETKDQDDLALLIDSTLTKKRLAKEQQRLAQIQSDQEAARVEAFIFGTPHQDADTINFYFAAINKEILNADALETPLLDIKERLQAYYAVLRPYILERSELAEEFGEDYISSCETEEDLREAIDTLQNEQRFVNVYPGIYDQLSELAWQVSEEEDEPTPFADTEVGHRNRERFLRLYEELSPYLVRISGSYWPSSFVRELQTPQDFHNALKGILAAGKKLEELVEGLKDANALKQKVAQERILYFSTKLAEEKTAAVERVKKFKSDTFDNYLDAEVFSKFTKEFEGTLGLYLPLFLEHMKPDFLAAKEELLKDITMEQKIAKEIASSIDAIVPTIVANHDAGRQAYAALNASLQQLNGLIAKENSYKPNNNPLRAEKLAWMEAFHEELMKIEQYRTIEAVTSAHKELQDFLDECNDYDIAIKTYETLMQMNAYIVHQEDGKTVDAQAKIDEIGRMQRMLANDDLAHLTPARRLTEVKAHLKNSNCETVLSKNSDGILMQLVNALRAFLFGWKSPEQTMFDSFKTTLSSMKETPPKPAVSVEESSIPVDNSRAAVGSEPVVMPREDEVENANEHHEPLTISLF